MPKPLEYFTKGPESQEQRREVVVTTLSGSFFVLIPFTRMSFNFKSPDRGAQFDCSGWLNF